MNPATIMGGLALTCFAAAAGVYLGVFLERRRIQRLMEQYNAAAIEKADKRWKRK